MRVSLALNPVRMTGSASNLSTRTVRKGPPARSQDETAKFLSSSLLQASTGCVFAYHYSENIPHHPHQSVLVLGNFTEAKKSMFIPMPTTYCLMDISVLYANYPRSLAKRVSDWL